MIVPKNTCIYTKGENILYLIYDREVEGYMLSQFHQVKDEDVLVIPESQNGVPIKGIMSNAFCSTSLKEVIIPDTIEKIDQFAFSENGSLGCLKIGKGVHTIIPEFLINTKPQKIQVDKDNETYQMKDGNLINIKTNALIVHEYNNDKIISIPEGIIYVAKKAFKGNRSIEMVKMPDSLIDIGSSAFSDCENLSKVIYSENLKNIGRYAFAHTGLKNEKLPKSVEWISVAAYSNCEFLKSLDMSNTNITTLHLLVLYCPAFKKMFLPDNIELCVNLPDTQPYKIYVKEKSRTDRFIKNNGKDFRMQEVRYKEKTLDDFIKEMNSEINRAVTGDE